MFSADEKAEQAAAENGLAATGFHDARRD